MLDHLVDVVAYGSLMAPQVMHCLTRKHWTGVAVSIPNYRRNSMKGKSYPGIAWSPGSTTAGILYRGIDRPSLEILNSFEQPEYDRRIIEVVTDVGESLSALAYVVPEAMTDRLSDEPWDFARFKEQHLAHFLKMCKQFRADC